uniref:receptor-like protein 43 n=1 Tax=Erigeron canadensis TaxID=72917 RepID=UPI001CB92E81|nr:receptor-like protein 43 [Erigeron canadensis]
MNLFGSLPDFPINGSLRSLVLSNTNFSGGISDTIGNLKNLSRIELPKSNFSGQIPKSMEKLTRLAYLDLSSNNFSGEIPSFQMCKNLTHVDLSRNGLSGTIPSVHFQDLQSLVYVDLRFNAFNGSIPPSLFSLQQVQKIQLSNNNFDGLIPNFSNPSASLLDTLDLRSNRLDGEIPKSLFELGKLSILLLSLNKLSGSIRTIDFQGRLTNLTTLDLSFNNLSIVTTANLTLVNRLPNFSSLKLASCNLQMFPNLRNQSRLINLDLSNNKIEGEIPSWIWRIGNGDLSYLNLSNNRLHGNVNCAENQQNNWSKLQILDIASNNLSGKVPTESFSHWAAMMTDDLSSKKHLSFRVLPLTEFYYQDTVQVTMKGHELELVKILTIFTSIDISSNHFSGEIPTTIGRLGALYLLNVSNNEFTGPIPSYMGNLSKLESLDMSRNRLTGEIPHTLSSLTFLSSLNLSFNQLTGRIPTGSQFQTFENNSYLGNKGLCGFPLNITCTSSILPIPIYPKSSQESKKGNDWLTVFHGMGAGAGTSIVLAVLYSIYKRNTGRSRQTNLSR